MVTASRGGRQSQRVGLVPVSLVVDVDLHVPVGTGGDARKPRHVAVLHACIFIDDRRIVRNRGRRDRRPRGAAVGKRIDVGDDELDLAWSGGKEITTAE